MPKGFAYPQADTEGGLPAKTVRRVQNATNEDGGAVLAYASFYLSEFGWKHGEDGTKALQEIIDYCVTNEVAHAEVRVPPLLELNSAPRTDRQGNAIVALPKYLDPGITIKFVGQAGGSEITTNREGLTYSAEHGAPSIIGGPTPESLGITEGNGAHFSGAEIHMIDVTFRAPNNPTICGLDLSRIKGCSLDRVFAYGIGVTTVEPTNKWAFGIRLPEGDNNGRVVVGKVLAEKWYVGIVANSAHLAADAIQAKNCVLGFGIIGNTQSGGNDGHSSSVSYLLTEHCKYHVGSWSPTEGAISIPATHPAQIVVQLWDIEDQAGVVWQTTTAHLLDANSQISGLANYARVVENTGPVSGALTVTGGRKLGLYDMTFGPLLVNPPALAESTGTIGLGLEALAAVTSATGTTAIGYKALAAATTEPGNTAVGHEALPLATGQLNTAVGRQALGKLEAGTGNVAVGRQVLLNSKTGEHNVAIGTQAGEGNISGSNSIFIGYQAGKKETNGSRLYIANSETAEPLIFGNFTEKELRFFTTKVGFFGATAAVKPEVTGLTATVKQLAEALATLGLIKVN